MMGDPTVNFYEVQAAFNAYWAGKPISKGKGYKAFKRWENYMEPRVYPSGDRSLVNQTYPNFLEWERNTVISTEKSVSGQWQMLTPSTVASGGGAGRANFIRIDPTNTNTIFIGTPVGGLWKSTTNGGAWTTNTDQLSIIGCSDLAIHPTNNQIMYIATGDADASDVASVGILKSIDGGATWNTTGLTYSVNQQRTISRIIINPVNPNIVIATTSNGVMRSIDAGVTFSTVISGGDYKDAEFKPGDPQTVYAVSTFFKKSTDGGATWTTISSGLPSSGIRRISLAVTAANSAYVYLLYGRSSDDGLLGIYRSTDSGTTFSQRSDATPNYLGWEANASDAGGQAFYDLTIAASPINAELVVIGGINSWKSTNGGSTFTILTHWYGAGGTPYSHADHHDIQFSGNGTTLYDCNDGGLFKSTGAFTSWTDVSSGLAISQQYRIGLSTSNPTLMISGHQDNGTNKTNGTSWNQVLGGDGMDCFIDRTNNNIMVGSTYYGDYSKSTNGGNTFNSINNGLISGDWVSVLHQDPVTATTYYAGGRPALYRTTNSGSSWTALGTPASGASIIEFAIAPSNNQTIYAITDNLLSKSTNGGTSWSSFSTGLPFSSLSPTNVTVSNTDANVAFVTFSGYTSTNKVYKTINGGTTWTNISTGLPNVPCNTIVYQNGSNGAVYVGTDVGVFYRDNALTSWTMFSTGLPRTSVRDLEIYYATGRLRAGTYGRGTWDSDLYTNAIAPTANFSPSSTNLCSNQTVTFTNTSTGGATSYAWSFPGGTPATSTATNPTVTYATAGTYNVELIATNTAGSNTATQTALINVTSGQAIPFTEGFVSTSFPYANWTNVDLQSNGGWAQNTFAGNNPTNGNSVVFNNFDIDDRGFNDFFTLPKLNLTSVVSANLTFDVAYAPFDAVNFDSLEVLVSTDCGLTYSQVYLKTGNSTLATSAAITTIFTPSANEWRTETVDLSAYISSSNLELVFKNHSGFGNRLFIDNINISGVPGTSPTASFTQNSTSICPTQTVTFTNTSVNNPETYLWTFEGGTPATSTSANPVVTYATAGTYDVTLVATNNFGSNTATMLNQVNVNSAPAIPIITASSPLTFCTGGSVTLTSSATSGNTWSNGAITNSITVNSANSYTVSNSNGNCSSTSLPSVVIVNTIPNAPIITANGSTTLCSGGNVTISSSTSGGNVWSTGATSQTITVSATTSNITNTVTVAGCTSSPSNAISVTVNPAPAVPTITASGPLTFCQGGSVTLTSSAANAYLWSNGAVSNSITVSAAGTYTVSSILGLCSSLSAPKVVVVNALPNAPLISNSGALTFCEGGSVNLTSSSANGNVWSNGATSQTITVASSANLSSTVTSNGCTSLPSNSVNVTVNALPVVNFPSFTNSICDSASNLTLNTATPAGGTYTGNGVVSNTFNPSSTLIGTNNITYTFTDANNCSASQVKSIVVTNCSGASINEANIAELLIFPNPAHDFINLKGEKLLNYSEMKLIDNEGKIVGSWKIDSNEETINISKIAQGNYSLIISNSSEEISNKIQIIK